MSAHSYVAVTMSAVQSLLTISTGFVLLIPFCGGVIGVGRVGAVVGSGDLMGASVTWTARTLATSHNCQFYNLKLGRVSTMTSRFSSLVMKSS